MASPKTNGFRDGTRTNRMSMDKHSPPMKKRPTFNDKSRLPVVKYKETFFKLINDSNTVLVVGETGSGKTTQIPKWCMEYCHETDRNLSVACTQPRRIAAITVATRVASEMGKTLGQEVGYSVRFENNSSNKTKLKYLTDGMLLREAMLDDKLSAYGVILLDEAHERTLQTEILFGVVKQAQAIRNSAENKLSPLKVIVMSATLDVELFKQYFKPAMMIVEGRSFPIQELYTEVTQSDLLNSALITVFQVHRTQRGGDILVFCAGQEEIQSLVTLCKRVLKLAPESLQNLTPLPLYASLPSSHQMKVFEQTSTTQQNTNGFKNGQQSEKNFQRRVIFSTNVAETSVTIPNIRYVIDTGKVKCRSYCPTTGLESLKLATISKAQAKQRSGRSGRVGSGVCYHLFTSEEHDQMVDSMCPEIKRCNLDGVLLQMISIGISNISTFEFLEKPEDERIRAALRSLLDLKAIKVSPLDDKSRTSASAPTSGKIKGNLDSRTMLNIGYELTSLGKKLAAFPLNPSMSRVLVAANELGCLDEALTVVSLLSIENLFHITPNKQELADSMLQKFHCNEGDTIMMLKVFKAFKRTGMLNRAGLKQWCAEHFIHAKNLRMARLIRKQLQETCRSIGMEASSCGQDTVPLRKALTYGFFNNVATMWSGKYKNKSSDDIHIHPSSCLFKTRPETVLYTEIVETNKCYMRNCTLIDSNWVRDITSATT